MIMFTVIFFRFYQYFSVSRKVSIFERKMKVFKKYKFKLTIWPKKTNLNIEILKKC